MSQGMVYQCRFDLLFVIVCIDRQLVVFVRYLFSILQSGAVFHAPARDWLNQILYLHVVLVDWFSMCSVFPLETKDGHP